jgi:GcrA cell cycle regulator
MTLISENHSLPACARRDPYWTDERTELLKKLWGSGLSCSQIAEKFGDCTRNAVLGKLTRLGLPGRKQLRPRPIAPNNPPPPRPAPNEEPAGERFGLADLTAIMCHFPLGDPREPGFGFCGAHKSPLVPYCDHHAALAYPSRARARYVACGIPRREKGASKAVNG